VTSPTLPLVGRATDAVRNGLHAWMGEVVAAGGAKLPVVGSVPTSGGPALVLLPYQMVLESNATSQTSPIVPVMAEPGKDSVPPAWRRAGLALTRILVDTFPKREAKGPGVGPVDPAPLLSGLPAPVAAWYKSAPSMWRVTRDGKAAGLLPSVEWHPPFALAVRFAAMVPAPANAAANHDAIQLRALALCAAAVRLERFFPVEEPTGLDEGPLRDLLFAFSKVDHPEATFLRDAIDVLAAPRTTPVGLSPHQDLSDQDLALIMTALRQPMQPTVVFSVRVPLGAGPSLSPGATPHLASVETSR